MPTLNKILLNIQGRTLILYYRVNRPRQDIPPYIEVLPSDELSQFNLKGLNPEMFCVNLADMVNIHGKYSGQVLNEKQMPVARWSINPDEIKASLNRQAPQLTLKQAEDLLLSIYGLVSHDREYFDYQEFSEHPVQTEPELTPGYRLTIVLEEIEGHVESYGYFILDMHDGKAWLEQPPPLSSRSGLIDLIENKLKQIRNGGLKINSLREETDYSHSSSA